MMRFIPALAGIAALATTVCSDPGSARASTVTETFAFTATNFTNNGSASPYPTVTGSFTLAFDPTQPVTADATAGLTENSLAPNLSDPGGIGYQYDPRFGGQLVIGGLLGTVRGVGSGTSTSRNDFFLDIENVESTTPTFDIFYYAVAGTAGVPVTGTGTVTATVAPAPEPASAGVLAVAAAGLLGRRRQHG